MGTKVRNQAFTLVSTARTYSPSSDVKTLNNQSFAAQQTITGGINPRWQAQIKAGENATTSLSVVGQATSVLGGSCSASFKTSPTSGLSGDELGTYFGLVFSLGIGYPSAISNSNAEALAVKKLYAKIRSTTQQFAGGLFAAEIQKTTKLITRPGSALLKSALLYKKQSQGLIRKALTAKRQRGLMQMPYKSVQTQLRQQLAGDYLKWTFGAQPLLGDIEDATKALGRILDDPPRTRFKVTGKADSGPTRSSESTQSYGCLSLRSYIEDESWSQVTYYGMFQEAKRDPGVLALVNRVGALSGFSLRSFVPTMWELIPYSFLVDYFVNVGDMLEAANTDTSAVKWISRTAVDMAIRRFLFVPDFKLSQTNNPTKLYQSFSGSPGGIRRQSFTISRQAATVPYLVPRLNFDLGDVRHMMNIAALLLGR